MTTTLTDWLRWCAVAGLGAGGSLCALWFLLREERALRARLRHYSQGLSADLAFLRLNLTASQVMSAQLVLCVLTLLCLAMGWWLLSSVAIVVACAPAPWLHAKRAARVTAIEAELDGWLRGLASSLRATPALGEALAYSATLSGSPLRDELELLLRQHRLGVALDMALAQLAERVSSRSLSAALSALRIGRNLGGDLPTILERSAGTLREMARLEGVVRTKTAEGKAQAFVIAVLPFPMIGLLSYLNPSLLQPLMASGRGYALCACALALWIAAIVLTRRILDVDI